jgi:TonB-dependent starch-binding outer membrane protein SusC
MKPSETLKQSFRHFKKKMFVGLLVFFVMNLTYAQEHILQGVIIDDSNIPIPGATILIKGTTTGTVSDVSGKFSLNLTGYENPIIKISYVGYLTEEVVIGTQTEIQVTLVPDLLSLD